MYIQEHFPKLFVYKYVWKQSSRVAEMIQTTMRAVKTRQCPALSLQALHQEAAKEMMAQWFSTWGALTYRGVATRVFHVLKLLLLSGIDGKNFLYIFMLNIVNFDLRLILEHFCLFNISDCTNIVFENDSGADETKCNFLIAATKFSAQM